MTDQLESIRRFSSRRQPLERSFLCDRLQDARAYERIARVFLLVAAGSGGGTA